MRNMIIDEAINDVIDASSHSREFKVALKQYIRNMFDGNAKENDLRTVLNMIEETEGEEL